MTLLGPSLQALLALLALLSREPCPAGSAADPARATVVRSLLARAPESARLASLGAAPAICFAEGEGGLTGGTAILPRELPPAAQAARLAHLWQHAIDHLPTSAPRPDQSCAAWLAETREIEQEADALEARVAASLDITLPPRPPREVRCPLTP